MTNEEAKKKLEAKLICINNEISGLNHDCNMRLCDACELNYEQGTVGEQKDAIYLAIKALEAIEQVNDDYISRSEVHDLIATWLSDYLTDETREALETINYKIGDMQPVTIQRRTGKWIKHPKGIYAHLVCSKCLCSAPYDCKTLYCPDCGAYMVESDEVKND